MTVNEVRCIFDGFYNEHGLSKNFPSPYEVDHETYANCCQYVFDKLILSPFRMPIALGPNKGLMFKGVELVLKK